MNLSNIKISLKDGIFILIIAFLLYGTTSLFLQNRSKEQQIETVKREYQDSLKTVRLENGQLASTINTVILERDTYKQSVDSIAKLLKLKPKYIKGDDSYVYVNKIDTVVNTEVVYVDKDSSYNFTYKDNWTTIKGAVNRLRAKLSYLSVDTISRVETSKTTIFGKTIRKVILTNSNPNNKLQAGYSYTQKEKRTYLTIGPSIQYDPFTNKVNFGFSVQYPLIQLKR
jgi:hypothetical protein